MFVGRLSEEQKGAKRREPSFEINFRFCTFRERRETLQRKTENIATSQF